MSKLIDSSSPTDDSDRKKNGYHQLFSLPWSSRTEISQSVGWVKDECNIDNHTCPHPHPSEFFGHLFLRLFTLGILLKKRFSSTDKNQGKTIRK